MLYNSRIVRAPEPEGLASAGDMRSLKTPLLTFGQSPINRPETYDAMVCRQQAEEYSWINTAVEYPLFLLAHAPISLMGRTKSYVFNVIPKYEIDDAKSGHKFGQIEFRLPDSQRDGAYYRIRWHTMLESRFSHTAPCYVVEWGFGQGLNHRKTLIAWTDSTKEAINAIGFTEDRISPASFPNSFPWAEQRATDPEMRWMNYKIREHARKIQDSIDPKDIALKPYANLILDASHFKYEPQKSEVDAALYSLRKRGGSSVAVQDSSIQSMTDWERIRTYVDKLPPSLIRRIGDLFEVRDRFRSLENGDRLLLVFLDSYNLLTINIPGLGIADSVRTVQALRPLVLDQITERNSNGLAHDTEALMAFLRAIRDLNPVSFSEFVMHVLPFCKEQKSIDSVLSLALASDGVAFAKRLREYVRGIAVGYQPSPLWKSAFDKVSKWAAISGEDYDVIKGLKDEHILLGTDYEGKVTKFLELEKTRPKDITDTWRSRYSPEKLPHDKKRKTKEPPIQ